MSLQNPLFSTLLHNFWGMFWFVSALIGQFRLELNRIELVHGFLQVVKSGLSSMEPSINATNNWFETFWAWLTHYFEAPSREGPLLTDSKNHAPILLCSTLSSIQAGANQNIHQKLWRRVEKSEFKGSSSGSGLTSTICVHAVDWHCAAVKKELSKNCFFKLV